MKEYFEMYDALMEEVYSFEVDEMYYEEMEAELEKSLKEEYMWYKHEDYMLWESKPLHERLIDCGKDKKEAISIEVFAIRENIDYYPCSKIIELWEQYTILAINLKYSLDFICDTVLYYALNNRKEFGDLIYKVKEVFCK